MFHKSVMITYAGSDLLVDQGEREGRREGGRRRVGGRERIEERGRGRERRHNEWRSGVVTRAGIEKRHTCRRGRGGSYTQMYVCCKV